MSVVGGTKHTLFQEHHKEREKRRTHHGAISVIVTVIVDYSIEP
jgi:hypothetical protein